MCQDGSSGEGTKSPDLEDIHGEADLQEEMNELADIAIYDHNHCELIDQFLAERFIRRPWWVREDVCLLALSSSVGGGDIISTLGNALSQDNPLERRQYEMLFPRYASVMKDLCSAVAAGMITKSEENGDCFLEPASTIKWLADDATLSYLVCLWGAEDREWPDIEAFGEASMFPLLARLCRLRPITKRTLEEAGVLRGDRVSSCAADAPASQAEPADVTPSEPDEHKQEMAPSGVSSGDTPRLLDLKSLKRVLRSLDEAASEDQSVLVGCSAASDQLRDTIQSYAALISKYKFDEVKRPPRPLLLLGESGVGKEVCVDYLAHLTKRQKNACNCAMLELQSAQDDLYGHTEGAFTGALHKRQGAIAEAQQGILFLDEIGDLPLEVQSFLFRFLDDGSIQQKGSDKPQRASDVVIVAATNKDITGGGNFRKDLYSRFETHVIQVPPLRERREDIPLLVQHFLKQLDEEHGVLGLDVRKNLEEEALLVLANHDWPGNARGLRGAVERLFMDHLLKNADYVITSQDVSSTCPSHTRRKWTRCPGSAEGFKRLFAEFPGALNWQDLGRKTGLNGKSLSKAYHRLPREQRPSFPRSK